MKLLIFFASTMYVGVPLIFLVSPASKPVAVSKAKEAPKEAPEAEGTVAKQAPTWLVVVEEKPGKGKWQQRLFTDAALADQLLAKDCRWRIVGVNGRDEFGIEQADLLAAIKDAKAPVLRIVRSSAVLAEVPIEALTPEILLVQVAKLGG